MAVTLAWLVLSGGLGHGADEGSRRGHFEPLMLVETGARTGACDVLTFTRDGRFLLAVGDDKVVRIWKVTADGLRAENVLRWSVWREKRGSIYALALSPDREQRHVAIAGLGVRNGSVVVLERETGNVAHALTDVKGNSEVIWALGYAPSGNALAMGTHDGSVWLWKLGTGKANDVRRLGGHGKDSGRVLLTSFVAPGRLLSVAEDGTVLEWDTDRSGHAPRVLHSFDLAAGKHLNEAVLSPDGKRLAVALEQRGENIHVWDLDRRQTLARINPGGNDLPQSLVFDASGRRLAVGLRNVPRADFFKVTPSKVVIYDLGYRLPRPSPGPETSLYAEALAFHPDGHHLAVAGGDNYEVSVWDLRRLAGGPAAEVPDPGHCLWGVRLSRDGRMLAYQPRRNPDPPDPNARGQGPWSVFDLQDRRWASPDAFEPVEPLTSAAGWKVVLLGDALQWNVRAPDGKEHALPLDAEYYRMPQCYTFLPPRAGKPPRLAVGHYWGVSLFELHTGGPRKVRLMVGHQGYVTSVAPSADGNLLVTASRDKTIAAWGLEDWPGVPSPLGARFSVRLGKLFVDAVASGSPAWEAGLAAGDQVLLLVHDRDGFLFDPDNQVPDRRGYRKVGDADATAAFLREPHLGREYYFVVRRAGADKLHLVTRGFQRPLWRFFPTRDREWVLWRYLDFYYDASTHGDSLVGWQISRDVDEKPAFYPARKFEGRYHRPDRVAEMLRKPKSTPEAVSLQDVDPPALTLEPSSEEVGDAPLTLRIATRPRGNRDYHRPERLILWVGDFRYREWSREAMPLDGNFRATINVPPSELRRGPNRITLQCFSRAGISEDEQVYVTKKGPPVRANLHVLIVGVADYGAATPARDGARFNDLDGVLMDVTRMEWAWKRQAGKKDALFEKVEVHKLEDEEATPRAIREHLRRIQKQARPDDLAVLFFSGHGYTEEARGEGRLKAGTFTFVGPRFDFSQPARTGLTTDVLYEDLANIPCRKLVLLNACHSGDATVGTLSDPVRELTPGGVGPVILSAARHEEFAFVRPYQGSLFAEAVEEALDSRFASADGDLDGRLDSSELVAYVRGRVPQMLADLQRDNPDRFDPEDLRATQTPCCFPSREGIERFPLAQK